MDEITIGNGKNETTPLISELKSSPVAEKMCKYLKGEGDV